MSSLSIGYYPGCSGLGTSQEYDVSTRSVCKALGVELKDIPDWTCCGSTPAHAVDQLLSSALSARNFAQAEKMGLDDVITPCPSCLKNLRNALEAMEDPAFRAKVDTLTQDPLQRPHTIKSVLQVIMEDIGLEAIKKLVTRPLTGLRVIPYYGCLMNRPASSMRFDDPENPCSLDKIMEALGAEVLPFPLKVECCGASFGIPKKDAVIRLSGRLLDLAADLGADLVVVACPLCQMNLDLRQSQIKAAKNKNYSLPVPYYTQLMGYAFGLDDKALGLDKLIVPLGPTLAAMHEVQAKQKELKKAAEAEAAAKKAAGEAKQSSGPAGGAA